MLSFSLAVVLSVKFNYSPMAGKTIKIHGGIRVRLCVCVWNGKRIQRGIEIWTAAANKQTIKRGACENMRMASLQIVDRIHPKTVFILTKPKINIAIYQLNLFIFSNQNIFSGAIRALFFKIRTTFHWREYYVLQVVEDFTDCLRHF